MRLTLSKATNAALLLAACAAALYAAARWLLPCLSPFLIAFAVAALLEPAVARLDRRGLPRPAAAGLCLIVTLVAAGALLFLLLRRLTVEAEGLMHRLPELSAAVSAALERWETATESLLARSPEALRLWIAGALRGAEETAGALPARLSGQLLRLLPALAASGPSALLFAVTAVLGAYFVSASYPALLHGFARLLPERLLCRARLLRRETRRTLGRWLQAQGIMLLITFAVLAAAFALLRVEAALLMALLTALIDALPVLGAGTVLLPWALWQLLSGRGRFGVGLLVTYAVVTLLHQSIQAKLLGDRLGLHPLAMLAAIWLGFRVWGVAGMLVFPILAVCGRQALGDGLLRRLRNGAG